MSRSPLRWDLPLIMGCQLALTVPWMLNRTVYGDEALYTWAGHNEISRWLLGRPAPPYGKFFSGLPTLYPPLAALTGSLLGARLVSAAFALLATAMLYLAASRLYGRVPALAGCAVFIVIYPTMHVGSYATYDAMALGLLGTAGYFAVRAADDGNAWPLLCAVALLLANAAKYATVIYDPVVIGIIAVRGRRDRGLPPWLETTAWWAAAAGGLLLLAGKPYLGGILATTLSRSDGITSAATILWAGFRWEWPVLVPAALAAVSLLAARKWDRDLWLNAILAAAALLAPVGEARLHTEVSLNKHIAFGAWFAAIAAGYGAGSVLTWWRLRQHRLALAAVSAVAAGALASAGTLGAIAAASTSAESHVGRLVPMLRRLVKQQSAPFILTDTSIPKHEIPVIAVPQDWRTIQADKHGQVVVSRQYLAAIRNSQFTMVALSFKGRYRSAEQVYLNALNATGDYRFKGKVPFSEGVTSSYTLWERARSISARHVATLYTGPALPGRNDLASFIKGTGTHPNIAEIYAPFIKQFPQAWARSMTQRRILPVIQLNPRQAPLAAIAAGQYDPAIRAYAAAVRRLGSPVVLSFAHEMDGNWYPWGCRHVSRSMFIAAWRHLVVVVRDAGARNAIWMWTTNVQTKRECPLESRWPGARYVDWVGLDGYLRTPLNTFSNVFTRTLAKIGKLAPGKPVLLAETGALAGPGQAARIRELYQGAAHSHVIGVVYFDGATAKFGDYRPQDNPAALQAFRQGLAAFLRQAARPAPGG